MIFVIFFRFLASAVRKFPKLRPLQWPNQSFAGVNHQVERQPSTSTRHLPNIKKIVGAVFSGLKNYLFASFCKFHPCSTLYAFLRKRKNMFEISFLNSLRSFRNWKFLIISSHLILLFISYSFSFLVSDTLQQLLLLSC